ncbi:MAG: chemotaxis protein CheX [Anaeromyxobacter sp.]|nr:chemotaxis protein CheX [Anaeromyxobacter sp.]MBL0276191.1 chemotaxis protein CheX [Anaeromyxobacter sp.]
MADATSELLTDIVGTVLQDSAFMFVEPAEEPIQWGERVFAATLAFESVRSGTLRLTMAVPVGVELAANMLGTEPSDPEAEENGRAAVSEILNVIGGAFVTRFFGTKVPSQLGLPQAVLTGLPATGRRTCAAVVHSEAGDPVLLELDLE